MFPAEELIRLLNTSHLWLPDEQSDEFGLDDVEGELPPSFAQVHVFTAGRRVLAASPCAEPLFCLPYCVLSLDSLCSLPTDAEPSVLLVLCFFVLSLSQHTLPLAIKLGCWTLVNALVAAFSRVCGHQVVMCPVCQQ